jgi:hypothetical protein
LELKESLLIMALANKHPIWVSQKLEEWGTDGRNTKYFISVVLIACLKMEVSDYQMAASLLDSSHPSVNNFAFIDPYSTMATT